MNLVDVYNIKKNVKFLGYIPEKKLKYFYSKLNLFFSVTKDFEGFGLTILEAMSRKIPVVCTNVGGVSEFANKNSVTFVKPNDYRAIYNTIKRYLRDPNYFKQKTNLAIKITKKFTAQKMAKNYYEEIRKSY
jgi:glycosyltransferase involved in cell wall biosynthesis